MINSRENQIEFCNDIYWLLENSENKFDDENENDENDENYQTINYTHKNALWCIARRTCPQWDGIKYYGHSVVVKNMPEKNNFSNTCFVKQHPTALPEQKDLVHNKLNNFLKYNIDKYSFYDINVEKSLDEEELYILK
jgi:hypothetical protein